MMTKTSKSPANKAKDWHRHDRSYSIAIVTTIAAFRHPNGTNGARSIIFLSSTVNIIIKIVMVGCCRMKISGNRWLRSSQKFKIYGKYLLENSRSAISSIMANISDISTFVYLASGNHNLIASSVLGLI